MDVKPGGGGPPVGEEAGNPVLWRFAGSSAVKGDPANGKINGQAVESVEEYHEIVETLQPGGIANLALLDPRSGSRLTLSVRLPS